MSQVNNITIDELIKLLKEYDFKKNSIRKFANEYKISEKTVTKYLKQNNINYNSRKLLTHKNHDVNGRFCLSINSFVAERVKDNKFRQSNHELHESKTIEKIKINPSTSKDVKPSDPSKNQNLSEKSYEEKLKNIMKPYK
jgi:beta-lactamase superfamily II metal-dependent hydrolase